jgi:hypothetical protein
MENQFFCLEPCTAGFPNETCLRRHYQLVPDCKNRWNKFLKAKMATLSGKSSISTHTGQHTSSPLCSETQLAPTPPIQQTSENDTLLDHSTGSEPEGGFEPEGTFVISQDQCTADPDEGNSDSDMDVDQQTILSLESEDPFDYDNLCPAVDQTLSDEWRDYYPHAGRVVGQSESYFAQVVQEARKSGNGNIYHPFCSLEDWSLAQWFHEAGVSMSHVDEFLRLPFVSAHHNLLYISELMGSRLRL